MSDCTCKSAKAKRKAAPVVGLAGGIASGKSLVGEQFASLSCAVVDADRMGHELLKRPDIREKILAIWGKEVLDAEGRVDRRKLGEKVFRGRRYLEQLNRIVHPILWKEVAKKIKELAAGNEVPAVVVDAALLFESRLDRLCDVVIFVESPLKERCRRAAGRGWTAQDLKRRERFQDSLKMKRKKADFVIANEGTPNDLLRQVREILSQLNASGRRAAGREHSPKTPKPKHPLKRPHDGR